MSSGQNARAKSLVRNSKSPGEGEKRGRSAAMSEPERNLYMKASKQGKRRPCGRTVE